MIVLGFILLVLAAIFGIVGVLTNLGGGDTLGGSFTVFGLQLTGSSGWLFLWGIITGFAGMLGLSMIFGGLARRRASRRELRRYRKEAAQLRKQEDKRAGEGRSGDVPQQRGEHVGLRDRLSLRHRPK